MSDEPTDAVPAETGDDLGGADGDDSARPLSIGAVLGQLQLEFPDVSLSKIRFLESRGLISPSRTPSGYRKYQTDDIERLRWILRMQRDHFLPLRVIKERLDNGVEHVDELPASPESGEAPLAPPPRAASTRFASDGPENELVAAADLARLAGLDVEQIDDLVKFGLIDAVATDEGVRYVRGDLRVARAAASFLQRGIEARHLKAWRVAAEREAGMLEQIVVPLSRQQSSTADTRAREVADDLIDCGNAIREAILVKILRQSLGVSE